MPNSRVRLPAGLRPAQSVTVPYPEGLTQATVAVTGAQFSAAGAVYTQGTHFTLSFGPTLMTMTWTGPSTLPPDTVGHLHVEASAAAVVTPARAAHMHEVDNFRAWWQQMNGDGFEHDQPHVILNSTNLRYQASGADYPAAIYRCVGVGSTFWLSFGRYPLNRPAFVDIVSGTCILYSGDGGFAWRGTNDGLARTESVFTSVVFDAATSTCTFAAGDPVAEGYAIGDRVRFLNTNTNANTEFQIRAFGGTSNRTITLWPEPITDAVPDTAFTLQRRGRTQLTIAGPAQVIVYKSQVDIVASSLPAFTTSAAVAFDVPDEIRGWIGQSWDVRMAAASSRGQQLYRQGLALPAHIYNIDAATGAQAVAAQNTTANALWDIVGNQPGLNYAGSLTRLTRAMRAYPAKTLKHVQVTLGIADAANLTTAGGWLTWQQMRDAYEAAFARYVTDLNAFRAGAGDAVRFWVSPLMPSLRSQGVLPYDDASCNLVRFVQLDVVRRNPTNVRRGIEFHLRAQPFDDIHNAERVMGSIGRELEHVWLRDDNAVTYNHSRGPKITGMTIEAANRVRLTIDRLGGLTGVNVGTLVKPVDSIPYGVAICPNGDLTAAAVPILSHTWDGDNLVLTLERAVEDPLPVYPYGQNHYASLNWTANIMVYDRVLGQYQVLQTLAHTYNETTGRWAPDFVT